MKGKKKKKTMKTMKEEILIIKENIAYRKEGQISLFHWNWSAAQMFHIQNGKKPEITGIYPAIIY